MNTTPIIKASSIKTLSSRLKKGEIAAGPTDTVYGLIGIARPDVKRKIYRIKQRPAQKMLPLFVKDISMAKRLAYINARQQKFLKKAWPGPVTVVLRSKKNIPGFRAASIALRIPNNNFLLRVLKETNKPLTGTSANISRSKSLLLASQVLREFKDKKYQPDIIIQGGGKTQKKKALSSTIVDIRKNAPRIIRKGPISLREIRRAWNG